MKPLRLQNKGGGVLFFLNWINFIFNALFYWGPTEFFVFVNFFGMQIEVFRNAFHEFFEPDAFNLSAIIGMSEFVPLGFYENKSQFPQFMTMAAFAVLIYWNQLKIIFTCF